MAFRRKRGRKSLRKKIRGLKARVRRFRSKKIKIGYRM